MKATVFIAASVDGFIARTDGAIDWLPSGDNADGGEDYGYQAFFDSVDALVMGRNTYELARTFGTWPYGDKPVVVLSTDDPAIPSELGKVESMSGAPMEIVSRLHRRGFRHLYIDGGKTIQGFLAAGLIQRMIITRIPVLIGTGIPLFGPLAADVRLEHVATRHYLSGLVQTEYGVLPPAR